MLAGDPTEAAEKAEQFLKERSLASGSVDPSPAKACRGGNILASTTDVLGAKRFRWSQPNVAIESEDVESWWSTPPCLRGPPALSTFSKEASFPSRETSQYATTTEHRAQMIKGFSIAG
jgi:hypothetical protein